VEGKGSFKHSNSLAYNNATTFTVVQSFRYKHSSLFWSSNNDEDKKVLKHQQQERHREPEAAGGGTHQMKFFIKGCSSFLDWKFTKR
jgi:hypothetical protein